jgi:putative endonuclease
MRMASGATAGAVPRRMRLHHRVLRWLAARPAQAAGARPLAPHLAVGERGELEAFFALRERGYTVVARRWQSVKVRGDLDLVAWDGDTLCFVEVKARTRRDLYPAEFAVDADKRRQLRMLARIYLRAAERQSGAPITSRFDVASVYLDAAAGEAVSIELQTEAFGWEDARF